MSNGLDFPQQVLLGFPEAIKVVLNNGEQVTCLMNSQAYAANCESASATLRKVGPRRYHVDFSNSSDPDDEREYGTLEAAMKAAEAYCRSCMGDEYWIIG